MKVNAIRLSFLTCLLTLCQCASGPQLQRQLEVKPGDKITATYLQPPSGGGRRSAVLVDRDPSRNTAIGEIRQSLVTAAVMSADDLYKRRTNQFTKVIDDPGMQILLDAWATSGFFASAASQPADRATSFLILKVNGTPWVWSKHSGMNTDQHMSWQRAFGAFLDVFNQTTAYYSNSPAVDSIRKSGGNQPRTSLKIRDNSSKGSR